MHIKSNEVIYKGVADLKRVAYTYTDSSGQEVSDVHEVYCPRDAAAVLLYNAGLGTVLLTRQFRIATWLNGNTSGFSTEVCAGRIEQETPLEAVIREAEEECGYRITEAQAIMSVFMSPGVSTVKTHLFLAQYDAVQRVSAGGGLAAENESVELVEFSFRQALELVRSGAIADAKTILLLQYAQLQALL